MFALTHLSMPLTQMVHSWTLTLGKLCTLMSMQIIPSSLDIGQWKTEFVILPSRQASCHNGCEEEPRVSWQGTYPWPGTHLRTCNWSACKLTRDQLQWCVGLWVSSISTIDVQCRWKNECPHVQIDTKTQLQVTISERNYPISDTMIYDVSSIIVSGLSPGRQVNCIST